MTIPASVIANVIPGVLSPGGAGLVMNGLVLTENVTLPTNTVQSFASAQAVSDFFGPSSAEYAYASIYFAGMVNGTQLPSALLFASYNGTSARAATLTTGSFANYSLAEMQAISGVLTLTVNGTAFTSSSISLTGVASQSLMAAAIENAFTTPNFAVSWSGTSHQFVFTSNSTGIYSTITFGTGTISTNLLTTSAAGAVLSQGAAVDTPSAAMDRIWQLNQNWASMVTLFEPDLADKQLFAGWFSEQNGQVGYVAWDSDSNASVSGGAGTFGVGAKANNVNGVMCIGGDPALGSLAPLCLNAAAFVQGMIASINYSQTNGSITLAGKSANSAAVQATCANLQTYNNLLANGYSCYGAFASRNQGFTFFSNGNMPGKIPWANLYVDQIWLNAQFELALLTLYTTFGKIPYDPYGYGLTRSALIGQNNTGAATDNGPINNALNNGVIQKGVSLTSLQASAINSAAGNSNAATAVQNNGWYLQILDPGAEARNAGQTPIINFWYTSGGAVLQFSMASINVL